MQAQESQPALRVIVYKNVYKAPGLCAHALALAGVLLVGTAATGQDAPRVARPPTVEVTTAEVAVDFVVRDKKGRIVRDLKQSEVEVLEDGVPQGIELFRLISSLPEPEPADSPSSTPEDAAPPAHRTSPASAPSRPPEQTTAPDVEREAMVALVFDRLSPVARIAARDAALAWLKLPAVPGRRVGVYRIDAGLEEVQEFTGDREPVASALQQVARSAPTRFHSSEDRERLRGLRQHLALLSGEVASSSTPVSGADSFGELVVPGEGPRTPGRVGQAMKAQEIRALMVEIAMEEMLQELESVQQGVATTGGLLALVNGLREFPGRKAVIFFSEGLSVPERVVATLHSVISAANRGGVTFYAADAAGLRVHSAAEETRREMALIASSAAVTPGPRTRVLERNENVLRLDPASGLTALSRDTGGFLIRDTNDIAGALRRVEEELGAYYLLSYAPRSETWDGRYRRIELRVRRPGATVQARRGYYAVRTPTPTPVLEHEAAALASLEQSPNAALLPVRLRAAQFPAADGDATVTITARLAPASASQRPGKSGDVQQDFTVLALVRDARHRVVHKSSRHYDLTWPKAKLEEMRRSEVLFGRDALLRPGRYTVEVVAYDAVARKSGVDRTALEVPGGGAGVLRVSSLVAIGRNEPNATGDPGPLQFQGRRLVPSFGEPVSLAAGKPLAFVFTAAPGAQPVTEARVELLAADDEPVRSAMLALPPPGKDGTISFVGGLPLDGLAAGNYTLRVVVSDGRTMESRTAPVTLAP